MLKPLIVGFGRAGRDLHLHCLRQLDRTGDLPADMSVVHVVDPMVSAQACHAAGGINLHRSLETAAEAILPSAVVHVCTPPDTHHTVVARAAELGFRRFIIEKPMAANVRGAEQIMAVAARYGLDVLVVANWLASELTRCIVERIAADPTWRPLGSIAMRQTKSRLSRAGGDHHSAFDVEMPHLVALALHIAGSDAELVAATSAGLEIGERHYPDLGLAYMETAHANGLRCRLFTDLACPVRERSMEYRAAAGIVRAYFPADCSDSFSFLHLLDERGGVIERRIIHDDPLSSFLVRSYRYFDTGADRPESDVGFNHKVVALLDAAKAGCRRAAGRAGSPPRGSHDHSDIHAFAEV